MTSSESHVVVAWNWKTTLASYPIFTLLFNLGTQSLTLNSPSSTSRYALLMITSALPFPLQGHWLLHLSSLSVLTSQPLQKRSPLQSTLATSPSLFWRLRFPGEGRWNGVFLWTTCILQRLVAERSPGHPTVRPDWCAKQSQPLESKIRKDSFGSYLPSFKRKNQENPISQLQHLVKWPWNQSSLSAATAGHLSSWQKPQWYLPAYFE